MIVNNHIDIKIRNAYNIHDTCNYRITYDSYESFVTHMDTYNSMDTYDLYEYL